MRLTHGQAVLGMVAVTLMWSTAGVVTRHLEQAARFEITFWRSAFNALALLLILGAMRGRALRSVAAIEPRVMMAATAKGASMVKPVIASILSCRFQDHCREGLVDNFRLG